MRIDTDAVAALQAANAAIAAVTPRQRRALLADFYLRDAMSAARGLPLCDVLPALQAQAAQCIALGVLKPAGEGVWYLDLDALLALQRRSRRKELGALLLVMALSSTGVLLLVQ